MKFAIAAAVATVALAAPAVAGQVIHVGPFTGVEASDGAHVIIRHGATQQVTLVKGSMQYSRIEVRDGVLHLVTCEGWQCPHHYSFEVDVVMPTINAIEASDGADIDAEGPFPAQGSLNVKATDGGDIDARAIAAADVNARASDGGALRIQPRRSMNARAEDGGIVRYWGNPTVKNLVAEDGGSVHGED